MHQHLEGENRLEDDEHRAEVTEASEKQFRTQMVLDKIAEDANVQVSQDELTQYLIQSAAQYNMAPQDFVNALQQGNQLPALVGEVARNKALAIALGKVTRRRHRRQARRPDRFRRRRGRRARRG